VIAVGRNSFHLPGDFRIEISGWSLENSFFAERTHLRWTTDGEKHLQLHRRLPEGAIVFIRLLPAQPSSGSLPVAYRVEVVATMDRNGHCQVTLTQLRPGSEESFAPKNASNWLEMSERVCNVQEDIEELEEQL
jgi:hypothetical protein